MILALACPLCFAKRDPGWPGKRSNPLLPQVYHDFVQTLDLGGARREFENTREAEGKSLFGFSWLHACADRDAWRELIG
jgi:hypothetical protein